jgi:hypothetical protein
MTTQGHILQNVANYLKNEGSTIIDHSFYSPDLAPSDFWLFDYIKQRLDDLTNQESLKKQITARASEILKEEYLKT